MIFKGMTNDWMIPVNLLESMADKISIPQLVDLEKKTAIYTQLDGDKRRAVLDKRQKLVLITLRMSKDAKVVADFVAQGGLDTLLHFLIDDDVTIRKHATGAMTNISCLSTIT